MSIFKIESVANIYRISMNIYGKSAPYVSKVTWCASKVNGNYLKKGENSLYDRTISDLCYGWEWGQMVHSLQTIEE